MPKYDALTTTMPASPCCMPPVAFGNVKNNSSNFAGSLVTASPHATGLTSLLQSRPENPSSQRHARGEEESTHSPWPEQLKGQAKR